jgi:hypothetical protein
VVVMSHAIALSPSAVVAAKVAKATTTRLTGALAAQAADLRAVLDGRAKEAQVVAAARAASSITAELAVVAQRIAPLVAAEVTAMWDRTRKAATAARVAPGTATVTVAVVVAVQAATTAAAAAEAALAASAAARLVVVAVADRHTSSRARSSFARGPAGKAQAATGLSSSVGNE